MGLSDEADSRLSRLTLVSSFPKREHLQDR
jgi:hypothetical protein